ncbi:hypothetical protein MCAMS1_01807 [biofilm metagenome]
MHTQHFRRLLITFVAFCSVSITTPASANITCKINFKLSGWSFVYKQYDGSGAVRCSNGQQAQVKLASKGGGFTIGVSEIEGTGIFSELKDIREIYGTFVSLEGHAGVVKSAAGQVLTKGVVSLAMSGEGRGIDIGVAIGGLTISPIR